MRNLFSKYPERYARWTRAYFFAGLIVIVSYIVGYILSQQFLDSHFSDVNLKVLDKNNSLTFLSVLLAIQIPVFILFLEQMAKAGYIRRKSLPRVTNFKEIIIALIACGILTVVASRAAYLYFPILVAILINLLAVYRSVSVTFHSDQYNEPIQNDLNSIGGKSFTFFTKNKDNFQDFYNKIEKSTYASFTFIRRKSEGMISTEIRATQSGYITKIDVQEIDDIMSDKFEASKSGIEVDKESQESKPIVVLSYRPFTRIEAGEKIGTLYIPEKTDGIERLAVRLSKTVHITPGIRSEKYFDEILGEYKNAFKLALKQDDTDYLDEVLESYSRLLAHIDKTIEINLRDYSLSEAYRDIAKFNGNDFSAYLFKMYELVSDAIEDAVQKDELEIAKTLISFVYREIIQITHHPYYTSIARYDRIFTYALSLFIYPHHQWNSRLSDAQSDIRDYVMFRFKEHTEQLLYELKNDSLNFVGEEQLPETFTKEWLKDRIDSIRGYALTSVKNNKEEVYSNLIGILTKHEMQSLSDVLPEDVEDYIRASLFMIGGYLQYSNNFDAFYGEKLMPVFDSWPQDELLDVLLKCTSNDYADRWNIDTFDHLADGVVREVPNYNDVLIKLWVDVMLRKPTIPEDLRYYNHKNELESTLIFTGGLSDSKDTTALKYLESKSGNNVAELKTLVDKFIKVRRDWETSKLTNAELDIEKVEKFKELVTKSFRDNSVTTKFFEYMHSISVVKTSPKSGYKQFGINQVFDKEAFITDWPSGYYTDSMAEQLGNDIARGQDTEILTNITKEKVDVLSIDNALKSIKRSLDKWAVLFVNVHSWEMKQNLTEYIQTDQTTGEEFIKGVPQPQPSFKLFSKNLQAGIYFIPLSSIGKLNIFAESAEKPVRVEVDDYAHNPKMMEELIKAAPDFLTEKDSVSEQRKYLGTKVRLFVNSIFKHLGATSGTIFLDTKKYFLRED